VLTTGNHPKIAQWKHEQALARTLQIRPDLLGDED
jgi:tRNA (guanine37-N1)-methyltransferase